LLSESIIESTIQSIRGISLPEGGFACHRGESFRPDATAWAVLALEAYPGNRDLTLPACWRLAKSQLSDGRIPVIDGHPESYWPTALAVLAWKKVAGFERQVELALRFILNATGIHRPKQKNAPIADDPSIKGWPWIENTYSWIEPTALSTLALKVCGFAGHNRVLEAKKMILDRQLSSGGWNYGNTRVFGTMLRPNPVCTGHALSALTGLTEPGHVELSLDYLHHEIEHVRTPLSLSWAIFGLAAWSEALPEARKWILDSLSLQKRYGTYETTLLAQLIVAYFTTGDLLSLFFY
jgi:hypothetical protein